MKLKEAIGLLGTIFLFLGPLRCASQSAAGRQEQIRSHSHQAQKFLNENRPDLAIPEFRAIVALDQNNVDARGNLGVLLFFQGDYAHAIPEFQATLKLRPDLWKIQALLGIAEKRTGMGKSALRDLEEAFPKLEEEKIQTDAGMELIEIYSGNDDLDKAAATISALRSSYPTNVEVLYASYRIHSDIADESMLSLSLVAPASARMHQVMAHELEKHGHTAEAIENYRAALKIDPHLSGLHYELAEMLNITSAGKEEAESEYKKALALNPLDEASECRLGAIAIQKDDLKEAYRRYTRAVQLRPDYVETSLGLAKVLMLMGQSEEAVHLLEHAVQLDPTSEVAHFRLSALYRQTGRTADANRELEQYQKYKEMKEKIRDLYHTMRVEPAKEEHDDAGQPK